MFAIREEQKTDLPKARLEATCGIVKLIARQLPLQELLDAVHLELTPALETRVFIVGLYLEASKTVDIVHQRINDALVPGGSFPLGTGFTSQVIRTRQPILIRNWTKDGPRVQLQYATEKSALPESGITVPILLNERVLGVLMVQSYRPDAYDEDDMRFLESIAGLLALGISGLRANEQLDHQLQQRVSELETILSSMTDGLLIVDASGCVIRLNAAARKLISADASSLILGHPLDRDQWGQWPIGSRQLAEALRPMLVGLRIGQATSDEEVELLDDGRRVLSVSAEPLRDQEGALVGGLIVFRDITGRRELERLKDEMLSIASHDLRSPITVIRIQTELLQRLFKRSRLTPEALAAGLDKIAKQADKQSELLELLLDFSRIEAGRLELRRGPTDLAELARASIEGLQGATEHHTLVLGSQREVHGNWDELRLKQVFQNLLTNAIKYSPAGGTIEVSIDADDVNAIVRVRDPGVGLPPDELTNVFERFYRAAGTRRLEGAGLGLYICHSVIAAHGGRIWAESEGVGKGSTFCFTLPHQSDDQV